MQNHTIERLWIEVNARIAYPIKQVQLNMQEGDEISVESASHNYCISWFVMQVCNVGAALFISSWNAHPIPGMFVCRTCVGIIMLKEHMQGFRILSAAIQITM